MRKSSLPSTSDRLSLVGTGASVSGFRRAGTARRRYRPELALVVILTGFFAACGGGAPLSPGSGGAGDGAGGSGGGSGGAGDGSGGAGTGGTVLEVDGGTSDVPQEIAAAPITSTPNRINCGGTWCDATKAYCCNTGAGGVGGNATFNSCRVDFCPYRRECDETADCVAGEVCCFSVFSSPPPTLGSTCVPAAQCGLAGTNWFGCGSDADCTAVGAPGCVSQDCGGANVQTCGPLSRHVCH